jgi:hypothetical protein
METQSTIVNFGKHSGKTISQIAQEDINWLIWIVNNYNIYAFSSPNRFAKLKQSTIDYRTTLKQEARRQVEDYFKRIEEKNRETATSQYVGTLRKRDTFSLTVKRIKPSYGLIIATTPEGNEVRLYDKGWNLQEGQSFQATGTPTKHIEVMGVKQTYINRVNIQIS